MDDPTGRRPDTLAALGLPAVGLTALVTVWWAATALPGVEPYIVPTPAAVAAAYTEHPGYLLSNTWVTLQETLAGFALATVAGTITGTALAASRRVEQAAAPVLVGLNAVPKLAFAPLLIVWMGFGPGPKIVMVVLMCLFPIVLSTHAGLTRTPADLVELARSLSATRWHTFTKIRARAALPQVFVGLKTAIPLAVIGALVGELFGATAGLGYIIVAGADVAMAFAAIALCAAMTIGLYFALSAAERLTLPWVPETTP